MKSNFKRAADWLKACGKEPSPENLSLQIACHLEEMAEFLRCVTYTKIVVGALADVESAVFELERISRETKNLQCTLYIEPKHREAALDALCDMEVTGNGISYLAGLDKEAADQAVLASNEAKLVDGKPVILPSGKIGKPEGWQPPDLSKFV